MSLCSDMKIKVDLHKQKKIGKQELGDFCYQFGYEPLQNPSNQIHKTYHPSKKKKYYHNDKIYKSHKNIIRKEKMNEVIIRKENEALFKT